jgi:hypothetical protein
MEMVGGVGPFVRTGDIRVFDGIGMDVLNVVQPILFVSYGMFVIFFLPDRFVTAFVSAERLFEMGVATAVAMSRKIGFYRRDDFGIIRGIFWGDEHMKMVRQDDNGIDAVGKFCLAHTKTLPKQVDIVDENRVTLMGDDSDEIAVPFFEYSSIFRHKQ